MTENNNILFLDLSTHAQTSTGLMDIVPLFKGVLNQTKNIAFKNKNKIREHAFNCLLSGTRIAI